MTKFIVNRTHALKTYISLVFTITNSLSVCLHIENARFKRRTEGGRAFAVRATKEWNKLSVDIKQSTSVKSFKSSLFKIILHNQILSKLFL